MVLGERLDKVENKAMQSATFGPHIPDLPLPCSALLPWSCSELSTFEFVPPSLDIEIAVLCPVLQSVVLYSLPELDGAIDTVPLGGLVGDDIYLVPERVTRLATRLHK